jgi:hypothetical protein
MSAEEETKDVEMEDAAGGAGAEGGADEVSVSLKMEDAAVVDRRRSCSGGMCVCAKASHAVAFLM